MQSGKAELSKRSLVADTALSDPKLDRLDRSQFAKSLSVSIQSLVGNDSFAIGLCGPWGSGKTSVLNFVLSSISHEGVDAPIIVRFNPWWFSGRDHLLDAFLSQFTSVLSISNRGDKAKKAGKLLGTLASTLKPVSLLPFVGEFAKAGLEAAEAMSSASSAYAEAVSKDVYSIRKQIDEVLSELSVRIIVVMDDIDRLAASEIAQLFQILKAVADFPRTVYLLAFDHAVVTRAINEQLGVDGSTYLEKIIQLQIDIPPTAQAAIHRLFLEQLNEVLGGVDLNEQQKQRLGNLFHDGLKDFLSTPRAAKKLVNMLRFIFPPLRGEVNVTDMIGIASLNTFAPQIVPIIAANPDLFTGSGTSGYRSRSEEREKQEEAFHRQWLASVDEKNRSAVEGIVRRLFPAVDYALGGSASASFGNWETELRICTSSHFEKYFTLSIPQGTVGEAEWQSIVNMLNDEQALDQRLESFAKQPGPHGTRTRASELLERARLFALNCSEDTAVALLKALLRVGDTLHAVEDSTNVGGLINIDNDRRLEWLGKALLAKIDAKKREPLLLEALLAPKFSPVTGAVLIMALGWQNGTFESEVNGPSSIDEALLTKAAVRRLGKRFVGLIKTSFTLTTHPHFMKAVFCLRRFVGENEAKTWLANVIKEERMLVSALAQCVQVVHSHGLNDHVAIQTERIDANLLKSFFDLLELRNRCTALLEQAPSELNEKARSVLNLAIQAITAKGKPVKSHADWSQSSTLKPRLKKGTNSETKSSSMPEPTSIEADEEE